MNDQVLSPDELKRFFKKLKKLIKKYNNKIYFSIHDPLWTTFLGTEETHGCSAGIGGFCIIENGDIMPCRRLNLTIGNIRENSISDLWNNGCMTRFRHRESYEGKCKNCKHIIHCGGCRAIAKAVQNSEFGPDPQCFF